MFGSLEFPIPYDVLRGLRDLYRPLFRRFLIRRLFDPVDEVPREIDTQGDTKNVNPTFIL